MNTIKKLLSTCLLFFSTVLGSSSNELSNLDCFPAFFPVAFEKPSQKSQKHQSTQKKHAKFHQRSQPSTHFATVNIGIMISTNATVLLAHLFIEAHEGGPNGNFCMLLYYSSNSLHYLLYFLSFSFPHSSNQLTSVCRKNYCRDERMFVCFSSSAFRPCV
jgi:hypothetical protein